MNNGMNEDQFLKKLAYADGGKNIGEDVVTIIDHGKPYNFQTELAARALGEPRYNLMGISEKMIGFSAYSPQNVNPFNYKQEDETGYSSLV